MKSKKHKPEKSVNWYTVGIGIFIIGIMVFSTFYYALGATDSLKIKYNGHKFVLTDDGWLINIKISSGKVPTYFSYTPNDLSNYSISAAAKDVYIKNNIFYYTF